jgi:hypothetical protein
MTSSSRPPTPKQLRHLRRLAMRTGTTFAYPTTIEEAGAELDRLEAGQRSTRQERRAEVEAVRDGLASGPANGVQPGEVVGYGSTARWGGGMHEEPGPARVVNVRHEQADVYIGRGSRWGNPFSHRPSNVEGVTSVATREEAIARFRELLWERIERKGEQLVDALAQLQGKALGCYCSPEPCHGDVLVRAAAWASNFLEHSVAR